MAHPTTDLYIRIWGTGAPVVLIHGSTSADPGIVWSRQRELTSRYQLLVPDRRGYGASPTVERNDFEVDIRDTIALLGAGAHLVGLAYGGVIALLAAARRPDLVRSLTVIEPPAFAVARGHPAVERLIERMRPLYATGRQLSPEAFILGFARAYGEHPEEPILLSPQHRKAIQATMGEPPPWEAAIPLDALAAAGFPKLVLSGDWHPALEVVADILARRLGAQRAVISGAGQAVQRTGRPFNRRLEALIEAAADARPESNTMRYVTT